MANKSVLELAVSTGSWDAGLKKARQSLDNFTQAQGGLNQALEKESKNMQAFVQMMGKMDSSAKTAKGQMNDYKGTIEQLTMQYNRMSDAQKQSIGQDYLRTIDQLKQKYHGVNQEIQEMNRQLNSTPSTGAAAGGGGGLFGGDKMSGMLQVFGGNLMTKLAGAGIGFLGEMGDMVKQGIELSKAAEGVRIAFERLNQPGILANLREATHGTVTDLELMKAAVKFNDFKLPLEELGTMLAFAQQKAKDTGQSVDYMVDSIVTGLGRKSLMILDNLGLSAAEVREKMKETGDMTKAVGEIIREQMSKAGDYVETAADQATQANVRLQNAMTDLGNTFQPLTTAANNMWTDIKVGALDLLNSVIKPLIDKFTELGRMRAIYEGQSGDARVNRQLDRLRNIQTSSYRQGTYKAQLANYDKSIASHEQYLQDYNTWQRDKTAVGAYDRMQAFQKQTGLEWVSDVKAHLDAFKKMRAEYVAGAKAILTQNPAPSPAATTTTTTTTTGGGSKADVFDPNALAFNPGIGTKAIAPEASDAFAKVLAAERESKNNPLVKAFETLNQAEGIRKEGTGEKQDKERKEERTQENMVQGIGNMAASLNGIFNGIERLGVEIPQELSNIFGVVETIAGIVSAIESIETVGTFLGIFAHGGKVPHAATGYYVPGTRYSGDTTPILANAGELVLNQSSTNHMAAMISNAQALVGMINSYQSSFMERQQMGNDAAVVSGGVAQSVNRQPYMTGEMIFLGLNTYLESSGRGELMTSRFK